MQHVLMVPRTCIKCGSRKVLADGGQLTCARCHDNRGRLNDDISDFLAAVEKHFGPVTEPIIVRRAYGTGTAYTRALIQASDPTAGLCLTPKPNTESKDQ